MRRRDVITGIAIAATAWPPAAHAERWPTQLVRIVCPLAAGGGIDATARIVAARLSEIWRQQVVVENKSGASGNIAAEFVARSDPDGYTIYIATFPHATNSYLYPSLGYDPVADFAPVTLIGLYPLMMVVPNSSPAHSVEEFIAYAKVNKLSYASSGHGTSLHLAGELFKRRAGIEITHVPYRGAGPAFNDLIPGRVDAMINFTASSLAARPPGSVARARAGERPAARGRARAADHGRGRRCGSRGVFMVGVLRSGQDAAGHHQENSRRYARSAGRAGGQRKARAGRRRGNRLDAG